jgi:hypothetical protein
MGKFNRIPRKYTSNRLLYKLVFDIIVHSKVGTRGSVVVKALYYKPEGCGFNTQ